MLYVKRDTSGKVIALTNQPGVLGAEPASPGNPDVQEFLAASDLDFVRVVEDLVDLLIGKGVISLEDLPESAQLKLVYRKNARVMMKENGGAG